MAKCFVCPSNDAVIENQNTMTHDVRCPRCGKYRVTFSAADSLVELDDELKPRVSRWIHDQCALGTIPKIATREIEFLRSLKALPFENRGNRVLLYSTNGPSLLGRVFDCSATLNFLRSRRASRTGRFSSF
jgi:hypothetical protein